MDIPYVLLVWIVSLFPGMRTQTEIPEVLEFCYREVMNATCPPGHVIMMSSASYGRMRVGHCIQSDVFIGCSFNVLPLLDSRCSGRQHCEMKVSSYDLEGHENNPCPRDMHAYLEMSYHCVGDSMLTPTAQDLESCSKERPLRVIDNQDGYILGTAHVNYCPIRISAKRGQIIRLFLYNFSANSNGHLAQDERYPDGSQSRCGKVYASVVEQSGQEHVVCATPTRLSMAYTSFTHVLDVFLGDVSPDESRFLLKYTALGCADPPPPPEGRLYRDGDKVIMTCNLTSMTWQLQCQGSTWVGEMHNCTTSEVKTPVTTPHEREKTRPVSSYGLLIAVLVGVILGALCGMVLLFFVLLCRRRSRQDGNSSSQKLNYQSQNCTNYGMFSNHHCAMHQSENESPYTEVWRMECNPHIPLTSSVNAYCTTPNCTSKNCNYARTIHSDYDIADLKNERLEQTLDGSSTIQTASAVTYVCRHNKDYDKINQVPQIIQDSQACTVFKNTSLGQIKEENAANENTATLRSCKDTAGQILIQQ